MGLNFPILMRMKGRLLQCSCVFGKHIFAYNIKKEIYETGLVRKAYCLYNSFQDWREDWRETLVNGGCKTSGAKAAKLLERVALAAVNNLITTIIYLYSRLNLEKLYIEYEQ